ncbi:type IV secretory system conjugative DNA transfer family protein, partial [Aureimonas sp. SK2]|uniref:type IV secretory system conjugative DNA transfer family protein n=1 Tax=Aureimonas sp. SK2 TaxID=3015992 RepID=UPI002443D761
MRELRNLLLVGAPNSGKTRIILFWLNEIIGRLRENPRERLLVHDTTGEILRGMPVADDAIAAFHPTKKGGYAWVPGRDVRSMTSAIALATRLVASDGTTQGDNRVFDKGGVTILTGCIAQTRATCGPSWSFADLLNTLLGDPVAWKEGFARVYPPAAALVLVDADGNLNRTSASFILSVRAHVMQLLDPLARAWGAAPPERRFSFLDWIEGNKQGQPAIVVLQRSAANPALSALWIGSIVDLLASHACDESFNPDKSMRIRFVLDEIHQLGPLPRLQEILDIGRNKGVSVVAALQDMTQLRRTYGVDGAKEFLGRFATKIIGQAQIGPDADELAVSFVGTREIMPKRAASNNATGLDKEPEPRTVGIVRPEYLAYDLGANNEEVCAIALGIGDVVELSWPTTVWEPRR